MLFKVHIIFVSHPVKIVICTCVGIILQLREELQRAKQTHSGEVEGMRMEVSKLTSELHQRDLTIATLSGSTSGIKQQLRCEVERAEQKAAELKVREETVPTRHILVYILLLMFESLALHHHRITLRL